MSYQPDNQTTTSKGEFSLMDLHGWSSLRDASVDPHLREWTSTISSSYSCLRQHGRSLGCWCNPRMYPNAQKYHLQNGHVCLYSKGQKVKWFSGILFINKLNMLFKMKTPGRVEESGGGGWHCCLHSLWWLQVLTGKRFSQLAKSSPCHVQKMQFKPQPVKTQSDGQTCWCSGHLILKLSLEKSTDLRNPSFQYND